MFFGQQMRQIRKARKMNTVELANKIGVSDAYVSMLETGKRDCPDGKILFDIASALNCELTDLTDDEDLLMIAHGMFGSPQTVKEVPESYRKCQMCEVKDKEITFLRDQLSKALDRIPKSQ